MRTGELNVEKKASKQKNQGKRNQGPQMGRSVPRRGDSESSQCDQNMRKGERGKARASEVRPYTHLAGRGKDSGPAKLFEFILSSFEKYSQESFVSGK